MDKRNPHQRAAFPACPLPFIPTALLCLLNQSPALSAPTGTHKQGNGAGFQFYREVTGQRRESQDSAQTPPKLRRAQAGVGGGEGGGSGARPAAPRRLTPPGRPPGNSKQADKGGRRRPWNLPSYCHIRQRAQPTALTPGQAPAAACLLPPRGPLQDQDTGSSHGGA